MAQKARRFGATLGAEKGLFEGKIVQKNAKKCKKSQ
jgi:hypothetical protein